MNKENHKNIIIISGHDINHLNLKERLNDSFPNYKVKEINQKDITLKNLFEMKEKNFDNYDYYTFFQSKLNKWR